ncbi:MAG: NFACT RNA binding domain-containing protein [Candidatus Poribacteria bacterium]|nr:NFACT RNA binding domain-containing protein [Candidatus Poribacteria bacterium]
MSFDSLALRHVVHDLQEKLLHGSIRHVAQLDATSIALKITRDGRTQFLIMSAHARHARTHLIEPPVSEQQRSYFADFLMTHIGRGVISGIEQLGWDRVLRITIQPQLDALVESQSRVLIGEFMGKHSNIILVDESTGKILQSMKHIDETLSRHREILPGVTYTPPRRPVKLDPLNLDYQTFLTLAENGSKVDWRCLFDRIDGFSPTLAKELLFRADKPNCAGKLWASYGEIKPHFNPPYGNPIVLVNPNEGDDPVAVSPFPLNQFRGMNHLMFNSMSEALNSFYEMVVTKEAVQQKRRTLCQVLEKLQDATNRRMARLNRDLANAEQAEDYRIKGELLTGNLHLIQRGTTSIEARNYYAPEFDKVEILLDPKLSPSENAQGYFRKYTKAKRGRAVINQLIAESRAEQKELLSYVLKVQQTETGDRLNAIHEEFVKKGWIKEKKNVRSKQQSITSSFHKYTSPDGFQIYVGRNSKENDLLLRRVASGRDMWLHTKQIRGSHVLIRNPENKPGIPMPTLLQAAQIAAFFSKGKHASHVPVDYTWARYVVKPKGSAPGYVHYSREKTLYVEPGIPSAC